jgi:membrane-bound ClpP family serine protease
MDAKHSVIATVLVVLATPPLRLIMGMITDMQVFLELSDQGCSVKDIIGARKWIVEKT